MAADMEGIELFLVVNHMESEIYLFIKLTTRTFDDVSDVKSVEKTIPDDHFHSSKAASPDRLLCSNNILNRLNFSMNHQDLIKSGVFEQF